MAESENIGELYVQIKADVSNLNTEVAQLKARLSKDSAEMSKKLTFKAKFDIALAKLRLTELQNLRQKLQREFDKKVSLNVDSASLDRTRTKIASVDQQLQGVGKTAQSFGSKLISGFALLGGITAFFRVIKESIDAAKESAIAQAQITKAVETTGHAAGFTAKELFKLAEGLQKLNAIDDDKILTDVTNNLLTFKNVSGDAFKRAQQAILDLNAVISKGEVGALTSQTIQLGKALNDPIQGISALTRVGISFTDQQKDQIKALTDAGKLYEAQSLILTEIEGQYGGQAEALANATGGMQQFTVSVGNLLEKLGAPLLTVLGKVASAITYLLEPVGRLDEGFVEQKKSLDDLQKSITPLLTRYDELKSKTSLNKTEQDELRTIILRVAEAFPHAITAIDAYGRATQISTGLIYGNIEAEQKRLAVVNKSEIESYKKKKEIVERKKKLEEDELKRSLKLGTKTIQFSTAQGVIEREIKISDQDIKDAQQKIKDFQDEIDGYNAQLDLLKGKVDEVKPGDSGKVIIDTTAGDEILKQYQEQQAAIEQIKNKLKDVNLSAAERIVLQKELDSLIKKQSDKTVTTKFVSQIPKNYTAEQVAEYEKLKFAAKGYADYALSVIQTKYENELVAAKGNVQEILKAEEEKALGIAKLNQEILNDLKETGKRMMEETRENTKKSKEEAEQSAKYFKEKQDDKKNAIDKYYSEVGAKDEGYWAYKKEKIKIDSDAILLATQNETLAKQYQITKIQELEQEYFDWRMEQNELAMAANNSMVEGFTNAFHEIRIRTAADASALENIFADMANSFIREVDRMLAQWLLLQGFSFFLGGGGAFKALGGHTGGNFIGTSSGVKKMAGGGSFIVPPGFPNDSYPLLVESGEKINVQSAASVGMQDRLLKSIDRKLAILNMNTIEGQIRSNKQPGAIPLYGKLDGQDIYISNKRAGKVIGRMS